MALQDINLLFFDVIEHTAKHTINNSLTITILLNSDMALQAEITALRRQRTSGEADHAQLQQHEADARERDIQLQAAQHSQRESQQAEQLLLAENRSLHEQCRTAESQARTHGHTHEPQAHTHRHACTHEPQTCAHACMHARTHARTHACTC